MVNENKLVGFVKDWYINKYPSDDFGEEISPEATFFGVVEVLEYHELPYEYRDKLPSDEVYDYLGTDDSIIRERVFEELSIILDVSLDDIYDKWVDPYNYKDNALFDDTVAPYIFRDIKLTESASDKESHEENVHVIFDTSHFDEIEAVEIDDAWETFLREVDSFEGTLEYEMYAAEGSVQRWNGFKTIVPIYDNSLVSLIDFTINKISWENDFYIYIEDNNLKLTAYHHDGSYNIIFKGVKSPSDEVDLEEILEEGYEDYESLGSQARGFFYNA